MDDTYWHEDVNEEAQNVELVNGSSQYCHVFRAPQDLIKRCERHRDSPS